MFPTDDDLVDVPFNESFDGFARISEVGAYVGGILVDVASQGMITVVNPQAATLSSATASFISIVETSRNSRVWVLSFTVTERYSNGETRIVPYAINLSANNANVDGRQNLGKYTLIYDIKGNGSNIRDFRVVMN